ncbi:Endonuclease/exonuclease/phosphatase [Meredithblackwellia eburnea MCA 4105]
MTQDMDLPARTTTTIQTALLTELPTFTPSPATTPKPDSQQQPEEQTNPAALKKKLAKEFKAKEKQERKAANKAKAAKEPQPPPPLRFLPREWASVEGLGKLEQSEEGTSTSILTWNLLAQALVRRELFPNCDFLKGATRVPTLMQEVMHYSPDIACLQEVDRLEDHLPVLNPTYSTTSYIGYPNKAHGLLIAHKESVFEKVGERGLRLDELPLFYVEGESQEPTLAPSTSEENKEEGKPLSISRPPSPSTHHESYDGSTVEAKAARKRAGLSRSTRNVALMVALKYRNRAGGIIIATTHLFWHPKHIYERVRQTGILLRELRKFRDESSNGEWRDWSTFLAGDLNTQPRESTYRLILGLPLSEEQIADLEHSSVIHESVDKLHDRDWVSPEEESEKAKKAAEASYARGDYSQHPDRIIKNSRQPTEEDGLATVEELKSLYLTGEQGRIRSAYGEIHGLITSEEGKWYADRKPEVASGSGWAVVEDEETKKKRKLGTWEERVRRGDFEPKWTNFTPLWRCTLDYIFLLPPSSTLPTSAKPPRFTALLKTHNEEDMGRGLPKLGVEPSDHISLGAVVEIF